MKKLFVNELYEALDYIDEIEYVTQDYLKNKLMNSPENFPMICYEHTDDSDFEVSLDESKFLNDEVHDGVWLMSEKFIICLKEYEDTLEIDVLEVNADMRGEGIGGSVVATVETIAEDYYKKIVISPFDTEAINFWNHMGYVENGIGVWEKELDYES